VPDSFAECRGILEQRFAAVERAFSAGTTLVTDPRVMQSADAVFASKTQAYREVLLGCLLIRITDRTKDVHLPYVSQGASAFNGRALDEILVNPFLHSKRIPCSKGPYLSVFRRQVKFSETAREGMRDKRGYDSFLSFLESIAEEQDGQKLLVLLDYLLYRFVLLREEARIAVLMLDRLSLNQYRTLIDGILQRPSGGQMPVLLVLSMIETIAERFSLGWEVESQQVNVADKPSGAGGDITIREAGKAMLTVEVTERPVDENRVRSTFADKIAARHPSEYVFLVHLAEIESAAVRLVEKYFAQGYDISFVDLREWLVNSLATVGATGRRTFQERIRFHLGKEHVPKTIRVLWNEELEKLLR